MHSLLIISPEKQQRQTFINDLCQEQQINSFDITSLERDDEAKSIGIEKVKQMQQKALLKPLKSKTKAIILEDAELLTREAQNALLKILEEPPNHTIIILSTENREAILPTILSRCQIRELKAESKEFSEKEKTEYTAFIDQLQTMSLEGRLKRAEQLAKDKNKTIVWITNLILILREQMLNEYLQKATKVGISTSEAEPLDSFDQRGNVNKIKSLRSFQHLHTILKTTNINPRFAIEHTLLHI